MVKNRIAYYDNLRVLAIFAIVVIHVFTLWHNGEQVHGMYILMFVEIFRYAVPIFLMLSGALLLNRNIDLNYFLRHKLTRIAYPFIFYSIISFVLSLISDMSFSFNIFANYWYFWMILGVYLAIPIINRFIQHGSIREIEYFLGVFVFASIFYQFVLYFGFDNYFNLNFFAAPIGYLILGYYLSVKDFKMDSRKLMILMLAIFLTATFIKMLELGTVLPKNSVLDYDAIKTVVVGSWVDISVFTILQVGSLFVLFKHLNFTKFRKAIVSISNLSYGMYLINPIVMFYIIPFFVSLPRTGTEICLVIVLMSVFVFLVSWLLVWVLSKIPVIGKYCS